MTVTIITATYNSGLSVLDCIRSVAEQDYDQIEHLIIDGNSSDNTLQLIERSGYLESRRVKLISEPDKGIYDALNKGLALASGDVIGFLHSDDLFESPSVVSQVAETFASSGCDGLYGDLVYVDKEDPDRIIRYWKSRSYHMGLLRSGWMPPHPTLYLKRSVYEEFGHFNVDLRIAADYDFILRIFKQATLNFHYLPKVMVRMRLGGASNRNFRNLIRKSSEDLKAVRANDIGGPLVVIRKILGKLNQFYRGYTKG